MAVVAAVSFAGCVEPQRMVRFQAPLRAEDPLDTVVRALASSGYQAAVVDRATGIVSTEWQDSGFGYGFVNRQEPATIHRRFVTVLTRGEAGAQVLVRMDSKRCGAPHAVVTSSTTSSTPAGSSFNVGVGLGRLSVNAGAGQAAQTTTVSQVQTTATCEPMEGMVEAHQKELDRLGDELRAALGGSPIG
jgi:hypothetical protein